jgi:DNA topoisomerase-1
VIGRKILFPGYLKVYREKVSEIDLPSLKVGQELFLSTLIGSQHFTEPPARYTEASLVKELEKLSIGRPSTYAPIIQTIQQRGYVKKENRYFFPTDTGRVVTALLKENFNEIVDVRFTAGMEEDLDSIAEGKKEWVKMLSTFYKPFAKSIASKEKTIDRGTFTTLGKSDEKCPKCNKPMVIKLGKYGRFLSCANFPECDGMLALNEEDRIDPAEKVKSPDFLATYLEAPKTEDGRDFVLKRGRFGEFWAHPDYPKVKDARPLELRPEKLEEIYGKPPKTEDGRTYLIKKGRFGPFWAHPDYPKVKDIQRIAKKKK